MNNERSLELVRSLYRAAKSRLPRGIACNLLDVHASAARNSECLDSLDAAAGPQRIRAGDKTKESKELHDKIILANYECLVAMVMSKKALNPS